MAIYDLYNIIIMALIYIDLRLTIICTYKVTIDL